MPFVFELKVVAHVLQLGLGMNNEMTHIHSRGLNILVTDDELSLLESITFALRGMSHEVTAVNTANSAYIKIKDAFESGRPFEVLLLDLKMLKMSGLDLIDILKKREINVPVIVMSNYDSRSQVEKLGIRHFLEKPFSKEELQEKIRNIQKEVTHSTKFGV